MYSIEKKTIYWGVFGLAYLLLHLMYSVPQEPHSLVTENLATRASITQRKNKV